jgi:hypothetical protein
MSNANDVSPSDDRSGFDAVVRRPNGRGSMVIKAPVTNPAYRKEILKAIPEDLREIVGKSAKRLADA